MDKTFLETFYGKIIAIQGNIYWTDKYIVTVHKEIVTAVLRNPPEQFLIKEIIKDIPGQQSFLD